MINLFAIETGDKVPADPFHTSCNIHQLLIHIGYTLMLENTKLQMVSVNEREDSDSLWPIQYKQGYKSIFTHG